MPTQSRFPRLVPATSRFGISTLSLDNYCQRRTTTINKVTVTLNHFNHTFPDDVDVLLVSPTGRKMIIMSDAGGSPNQVNTVFTLDDSAATPLP